MAGKKGMIGHKSVKWSELLAPYQDFCSDRRNMRIEMTRLADNGKGLFYKRSFDGTPFEATNP